jgi:hypothetical protein
MPAQIIIVHGDHELVSAVLGEVPKAGRSIVAMPDPIQALDVLAASTRVELLITHVDFPQGKPHGVSLARMARLRRPALKVLFVAQPEYRQYTDGLGEFIAIPTNAPAVASAVERLLGGGPSVH